MTDEEFRAAFAAGASDEELAQRMGISRNAAKLRRVRRGLLRPIPGPALDLDFIRREFTADISRHAGPEKNKAIRATIERIAFETGSHPDSVRRALRDKLGLIPNTHHRKYTDEQYAEAKRLLDTGMPYTEAGQMTGIPRDRLGQKFPGMGLARQDQFEYNRAKALARELGLES